MPESEREREMEARDRTNRTDRTERAPTTEPPMERTRERTEQPMAEQQRVAGNGMNEYWVRFEALQAKFIEEPREAVRSAQKLVEEAVDRMMEGLRHTGSGDRADTEELRVAMKRYRDLLQQLAGETTTPSAGYAGTSPRAGEESYSSTPSAGYAGTSPRAGEESYSTTPSAGYAGTSPRTGEETRTTPPQPSPEGRETTSSR